ncbi:metalloregulator ArsR/SmtB family transcription factor [Microbaculum marinum]|uniref:Metalloregulator ArsR/SmtB family transcription factor n=1 Tax=Microbaculum marinum TaxID=1764581 RepID=A0AAW9RFP6_9HYPH
MNSHDVAARLEALGNPTRLEIVRILVRTGSRGLPVGDLRRRIGIAASTLSHHLAKLVTVGLISQERQATTLICRAELKTMQETADYLISECCAEEKAEIDAGTRTDPCCEDGCCGPDCCNSGAEGEKAAGKTAA